MAGTQTRLSAKFVPTAEPNPNGRSTRLYADGNGLYLQVTPGESRSYVYRYMLRGRARSMGLGSVKNLSLTEARNRVVELRALTSKGIDPLEQPGRQKAEANGTQVHRLTFGRAAEIYVDDHRPSWSNTKHADQWSSTLRDYAFPVIGNLPVDQIGVAHLERILKPVWHDKNETARRVRGRIEKVLGWCTVKGYRTGDNPARWQGHLAELFPKRSSLQKRRHHAALPHDDAPAFYAALRAESGLGALLLRLLMVTAVRTTEARAARWCEIDLERKLWVIPPERMKARREHRVPLSDEAIAILSAIKQEQQALGQLDDDAFVFRGPKKSSCLSNGAALALLKRMGRTDITPHGMRSTFRDWVAERTDHPRELAEAALAHALANKVEAAYQRGDLLAKRAALMTDWAAFLAGALSE